MWVLDVSEGSGRQVFKFVEYMSGIVFDKGSEREHLNDSFDSKQNINAADLVYRRQAVNDYNKRFHPPLPTTNIKRNDSNNSHHSNSSSNSSSNSNANSQHHDAEDLYANANKAAMKSIENIMSLQSECGHWPSDYAGPMFLMPGLVIACYVCNSPMSSYHNQEMIKYLVNHQNSDGGWGIHIEKKSTIFGSVLNYVAIRLLGMSKDDDVCIRARKFILSNGGAIGMPSWGKFWLCVLNCYDWKGVNPLSPELWLLPTWLPFHPSRIWCHARMVYLPMSYLYGKKYSHPLNSLTTSLRSEIFVQKYSEIDWNFAKNYVSPLDLYRGHHFIMRTVNKILTFCEYLIPTWLRKKALDHCMEHITFEDRITNFICIGPVNKTINMVCQWVKDPTSQEFHRHTSRLNDYLWVAEDGMKMQGYNGSQLWDVTFMVQGVVESPSKYIYEDSSIASMLNLANSFLNNAQVLEDVPNREYFYRHISKGAWPFSTRDHGWPISDCTAEGLKVALKYRELLLERKLTLKSPIPDSRLHDSVNVILSMQNQDGGWATYELTRAGKWMEYLNPSEVFGDIMIDYPYVECTSASVQALSSYLRNFPKSERKDEILNSIKHGVSFIKSVQRPDGSWYGSWAICFTYGTWFGVEGLIAAGEDVATCIEIQRAIQFLISKQNNDGGWGEFFEASESREWRGSDSQVVHTSWALLTLLKVAQISSVFASKFRRQIENGIKFLVSRQYPDGEFPQERITGVFNGNCTISYTNYRNSFTTWALNRYLRTFTNNN